jgi:hypothetical protein
MKPFGSHVRFSQRARRGLIIGLYLCLLGFVLTWWLPLVAEVAYPLRWVFMGLYAVLGLTLVYGTGLLDAMPSRYLDERQQALRDRAHRLAYVPVNYFVLGILLSLGLANHWFQEPIFIALVSAFGLAIFMLPAVIIAWLEPDPVKDQEAQSAID